MNCMSKFCPNPILKYFQLSSNSLNIIFDEADRMLDKYNESYNGKRRFRPFLQIIKKNDFKESKDNRNTAIEKMPSKILQTRKTQMDLLVEKMQRFPKNFQYKIYSPPP